ncbi:hypothetical protein [Kangiella koreensis]|uniref:Uncharacterized protein n=1 Tax=Kangiella koreensis (strain DSM 16069 / JCM 12317 / KCTC 12182 / SW-125) TaxID=523791 RepID=C7R664_KANKD|nr:hypothetical protein [Kangiella koreensis]ACV25495.1 hypothetical protein Kkor_0073 [Kangiella koreensis DSM 16069]
MSGSPFLQSIRHYLRTNNYSYQVATTQLTATDILTSRGTDTSLCGVHPRYE